MDTVEVTDREERAPGFRGDGLGKIFERDHRPSVPRPRIQSGPGPTARPLQIPARRASKLSIPSEPARSMPVEAFHPLHSPAVLTVSAGICYLIVQTGDPRSSSGAQIESVRRGWVGRPRCALRRGAGLGGRPDLAQFGYFGIFIVLVLGRPGTCPCPKRRRSSWRRILARKGTMHWIPALGSCFAGVLVGDFIVYFLGFFYGEKVLSLPLTRKFLTKAREAQIKGYFHRHGVKILVLGRFAVGFRTAAYLTAGILRLPHAQAVPHRPLRRDDQHAPDVRPGIRLRQQGRGRVSARPSITSPRRLRSAWSRLAAPPLRQGEDEARAGGRAAPVLVEGDTPLPLPPDDLHVQARRPRPSFVEPCPELTAAPGRSQIIAGVNVASTADPAIELQPATAPGPELAPSEPG